MKTIKFFFVMMLVGAALPSKSNAGLLFNYSQLAIKDLDQMNELVQTKVKESRKVSSGKVVPLKEALQAVYSRPNEDGMLDKVVAPLRSELDDYNAWEKVLNELTVEALDALKNPKSFKPVVQVTYQIFLENLLLDMKPFAKKEGFERGLTEKIRDAKVVLSKEAGNERKLRMMKSIVSPSDMAEKILAEKSSEGGKSSQENKKGSSSEESIESM